MHYCLHCLFTVYIHVHIISIYCIWNFLNNIYLLMTICQFVALFTFFKNKLKLVIQAVKLCVKLHDLLWFSAHLLSVIYLLHVTQKLPKDNLLSIFCWCLIFCTDMNISSSAFDDCQKNIKWKREDFSPLFKFHFLHWLLWNRRKKLLACHDKNHRSDMVWSDLRLFRYRRNKK